MLTALVLVTSISYSQPVYQKTFPAIDKYVDSIMKDWNIPGVALAIVYKDQLIYSKGYGYRDVEQKLPVQASTVFPIASNTKLFTATTAAMLAEEGKLSLDKPIRTYTNAITFYNDELNAKVTLRDMLSHRTGLPRYDNIWVGSDYTRKEAVSKVIYMRPQAGFREKWIYNNMMYTAAGFVMENVTGKTWEDLIREKLLQPLQMKSTYFTTADMKKAGNYSLSFFEKDSTKTLLTKKYEAQNDALGPAGTIRTSIEDISHWMIAQLNNGMYEGKQVIPAKAVAETMIPNIIMDNEGKYDELSNALYCLGRAIQTYKGYKITSHTGSIDGYYSSLTFIPSAALGIFMVHNLESAGAFRSAMAYPVIDRLLQLPYTPWSQRYFTDYRKTETTIRRAKDSIDATQLKGTTPSHPLAAYAGNYINPIYGTINIEAIKDSLTMSFKKIKVALAHFHYDRFYVKATEDDAPKPRLNFLTNDKGDIDRITMMLTGGEPDVFVKK